MNRRKLKREHQDSTIECSSSKANKAMDELESSGAGMDELLAVLGYKVRSSSMADVAQRLEQLEMALSDSGSNPQQLCDDTVHYNPADLSAWVHSMLTEVNPVSDEDIFNDASDYDLRAIPGVAVFSPPQKKLKASPEIPESPAIVLDAQEAGVRLVHTLMACAEAVQKNDMSLADALLKRVGLLAASQSGAMRKVANHFAEALARRIYSIRPQIDQTASYSDLLHMNFYETCPYLKFAHFTANQAILEAFVGSTRVHIVDFGLKQGMQWPALMQALALRSGGPPIFRLTGIGPPQSDGSDALQEVGFRLAQLAETVGVEFEFRGFVANSLSDVDPKLLELRADETVAVNAVFELHALLSREGALERVTRSIRSIRPKIVTVVEQEADHNGNVFLDRFTEALHYYSTMFDSLEISPPSEDLLMTELYLGKQICNVVACEGSDRVERHERLDSWRNRLGSAGFEPVHLGSNAFKQASMLLALFAGGEGYRVDENDGCLLLGWHNRPLIATSAWRVAELP